MKNTKAVKLICYSVIILTVFASGAFGQKKPDAKPLPNLVLDTIDGQKWSLYENRGRIVLLNFWATWCEPCRKETPMLVKLSDEYEKKGLRVVSIALDEDGAELIKKFIAEYKIDYPVLLPVPGSLLSRIDPVPTTLLIDANGHLAKKYVGALPEKVLRADIEKIIKPTGIKTAAVNQAKLSN